MGSTFGKIFLAFWLTLVLLGAAMYFGERSLGDSQLERTEHWLGAHAETAATLLQGEERESLRRWLFGLRREEGLPVLLLDADGAAPGQQRIPPPLRHRLAELAPFDGSSRRLERGRYLVVAPIDYAGDKLFLATLVDLGRLHSLSPLSRLSIALVISALVSLGLAALLSRPVRRLRRAAQRLADGDLSVRVGGRGRDEVAALGRDFDIMAERLREMLESQRRLLRDVSHELRSPLARLRIALELAERSDDPAQALARVEKEADELERLLANLLSLSRLESGQSQLERRQLQLDELLENIVADADFEARAHGREVRLQVQQAVSLTGDPVLLRAAIENVVRNAVRHTAENSSVEVTLVAQGPAVVVSVCDRGDGVPEGALEKMFEPFTRIGEARDRDSGGYGLGLAITGQVVAAHSGEVRARNRDGGGLCVELYLPLV